jgi:Arf-GAP with SH3 domain, ANK repeat and PH domain-containing protein
LKYLNILFQSDSRVYEFMAESDADFNEWISILNNAKKDAFDKELSESNLSNGSNSSLSKTDESERPIESLVRNILKKIIKLEGNDKCCDCGADNPEWLVTNLGILVCIDCCGIHR